MTDRCEPPEELRGVDGWHWVKVPDGCEECWEWDAEERGWWDPGGSCVIDVSGMDGYRYLAPVTPPAEVDQLRAERDENAFQAMSLGSELATLRATVAQLREALAGLLGIAEDEGIVGDNTTLEAARAALAAAKGAGE